MSELDGHDELDEGNRHRPSKFTFTVGGPAAVAYVEICDVDGGVTRVSVPPGSIWKAEKITLS